MAADAAAHSELLTEDYSALHPDGSSHPGRPTAQEIAAAPISEYSLTGMLTWPITGNVRLTRYLAGMEVKSAGQASRCRFAVGEIWVKRGGMWKCQAETMTK